MEEEIKEFSGLSDEEIVVMAQNKNDKASDYIMQKYSNFVRAKARTYFLVGADREDIIQEGMIGLFKAVRDFKINSSSFRSFAELCITRQIITAIKTATRLKHMPLNNYISLSKPVYDTDDEKTLMDIYIITGKANPEEIFLDQEKYDFLNKKVSSVLSSFEMTVFREYMQGYPYTKIAKSLNKSEKSIDNAIQRIKKKLEAFVKKEY